MRYFFAIILTVSLFACKNVDQYKAGVADLGTKWEAAEKAVSEFSTMVAASKAAQVSAFDSLKIDSTFMSKLKGADLDKVKSAITAYQASGSGLNDLTAKIGEFKSNWEAKSSELMALKDGIASGKIEGDVAAKIADLTNFISLSNTSLTSMKEIVTKSSEASTKALADLKNVVAPLMMKKK